MLSDSIKYQDLWSEKHSDFFHNQPAPRSEIHSDLFSTHQSTSCYRWIAKGRQRIENPDTHFRRSADPPAHLHCRFISLVAKGGDIGRLSQRQQVGRKLQGYCSVGYARVVEQSEKFDSIEYKNRRSAQLICDPKSIPIFSHNQPTPRSEIHSYFFLQINLHHAIVE